MNEKQVKERNPKGWWLYLVIGIIAIGVGVFLVCRPDITVALIRIIAAVFFIITGIIGIVSSIKNKKFIKGWLVALILSIAITVLGIVILCVPSFTQSLLYIIVGIGFFIEGVKMIIDAVALKATMKSKGWVANLVLGIVVAIVAIVMIISPNVAYLIISILIAVVLVAVGAFAIVTSFKLKKML